MKAKVILLGIFLASALTALQAEDADKPRKVLLDLHADGTAITGTLTIPPGYCVFGGFHAPFWDEYQRGFSFAVAPDVEPTALTFKLDASVSQAINEFTKEIFLKFRGRYDLVRPERGTLAELHLKGAPMQGGGGGRIPPEKPKSVTLQLLDAPYKEGQLSTVAKWTITYSSNRPADVVTLDLWVSQDRDEMVSKIRYSKSYVESAQTLHFGELSPAGPTLR